MAVVFDAVGPSSSGGGTTGSTTATSASWSHTCSGSNRLVVVGLAVGNVSSGSLTTTVTFGGTAMSSVGKVGSDGSTAGYVQLFSLTNPPTGASTVAVTASASSTISGGSTSFTGANGIGTGVTAFGSSASATVAVTGTTSGNMIADVCCCGSAVSSSTHTSRWIKNTNTDSGAGNGAGSTAAAGGSVTMGYTVSNDFWGIVAVEIKAAPVVPPPRIYGCAITRASFY